jgi:hypothetical protein
LRLIRRHAHIQIDDFDFGIERLERLARRLGLARADRVGAIEDLALQVGEIDLVGVGDGEALKACGGEIERRRAT